jgi:UDP-galactopyranose mutase
MQTDVNKFLRDSNLLVVGSGFFGLTVARQAAEAGYRVLVIDRREHPGGNAWSYEDPTTGIEVHQYGSHLFHTSNRRVWDYVNRFTKFNDYRHTVWTKFGNKTLPMPINLSTIQNFYERSLNPSEAKSLIELEINSERISEPQSLEEKAISLIGRSLYESLIKGYTAKQWETDPRTLPAEVITRLPVRYNYDSRYFSDTWEGLPVEGYHKWIRNMLAHDNINMLLSTDYFKIKNLVPTSIHTVYTGPIDEFFGYSKGQLSWRTLDFETEILSVNDFQGTSVMNFADATIPYTRIHEYKHLHPERRSTKGTVISREYSRFANKNDEPYYPVNTSQDRAKLDSYRELSKDRPDITFGGRLGTYQYLDMHMAIASALTKYEIEVEPKLQGLTQRLPK